LNPFDKDYKDYAGLNRTFSRSRKASTFTPMEDHPEYSIPSMLAIAAAVGSFMVGAGLGFFLAIAAVVLGAIGVLLSLLPSRRGGFLSVASILLGMVGVIAAIIRIIL
jgi:hypothetical protein